jgi:hypothetical protein
VLRAGLATLVAVGIALTVSARVAGERQERVKLCDPAEVSSVVDRFVAAFNTGNTRRLDRLFSRKPYFRWYSTDAPGERFLPVAASRASLLSYFARRHGSGERLTLRSLRVNGNTIASGVGWKTYGNFEYALVREADDLPPTPYRGKGALHCYSSASDQLIVWSMGRES